MTLSTTHGTYNCYFAGCRCYPCATAYSAYKLELSERGSSLVSGSEAYEHITSLGMSMEAVIAASGVPHRTVYRLIESGGASRIQKDSSDALLGVVDAPLGSNHLVDSARSRTIVAELHKTLSYREIGRLIGVSDSAAAVRYPSIRKRIADRIEHLGMMEGIIRSDGRLNGRRSVA